MKPFQKLKESKTDKETGPPAPTKPAPAPQKQSSAPVLSPSTSTAALIPVLPSSIACQVCFHLNPYQAPEDGSPDRGDPSWVMREFDVPAETRAAKIQIKDSTDLITAFENEKAFIRIYLAPGVPVMARLEFGSLDTLAVSAEDAVRDYGYTVPMMLTVDIVKSLKPGVEVEIYRPRAPAGSQNNTGYDLSALVKNMGFADVIPRHAFDGKSLAFIKNYVDQCHTFLTDINTLQARKAGIDFDDLPPLLQDVVKYGRALGIPYIWVDRLCIIQGEAGDFKSQAPKMGDIYGNATLTFAAASASSENDRIILERDIK
ncbi:hypothetical protein OQA88_5408 [Cercophora sp. LCS_1]